MIRTAFKCATANRRFVLLGSSSRPSVTTYATGLDQGGCSHGLRQSCRHSSSQPQWLDYRCRRTHGVGHRGPVSALMLLNSLTPASDGFTTYLHEAEASTRRRVAVTAD